MDLPHPSKPKIYEGDQTSETILMSSSIPWTARRGSSLKRRLVVSLGASRRFDPIVQLLPPSCPSNVLLVAGLTSRRTYHFDSDGYRACPHTANTKSSSRNHGGCRNHHARRSSLSCDLWDCREAPFSTGRQYYRKYSSSQKYSNLPKIATFSSDVSSYHKEVEQQQQEDSDDDDETLPFLHDVLPESIELEVGQDDGPASTRPPLREGLFQRNPPLYELNSHYLAQHGLSSVTSHIVARKLARKSHHQSEPWTAVFTCPITSTVYQAGTLRKEPVMRIESTVEGVALVCYNKKSKAVQAAAARALDAIQYQLLGITDPRLCEEDPSGANDLSILEQQLIPPIPIEGDKFASRFGMAREADLVEDDTERDESATVDFGDTEEEEEENLIITTIPVASREEPPSKRLLEAVANSDMASSCSMPNERMPLIMIPIHRLKLAIDLANSWSNSNQTSRRRKSSKNPQRTFLQTSVSPAIVVSSGRAILASLADANQSTFITSNVYGVEEAASKVLEVLLDRAQVSGNDENDRTVLGSDVFRNFLLCLEDKSPVTVATKAENFVKLMKEGGSWNEHLLPEPDTDIINTLIQLHAQVGGTSGRYDRLESDFLPDKGSFMAILSSLIYRPVYAKEYRGFDVEFCRQCIQRMNELADETNNEALRPDTHVYNAPLRWYGGLQFRKSRPYARVLPADNFDRIFGKGFPSKDDMYTYDALAVEAWLESMKLSSDDRIAPNIDTYEAVIQAWIRSGTRDGLDRAQDMALNLLRSLEASPLPRLQTFRPIIIAWVRSIDPDGPQRIHEMLELLETVGESVPELKPDARMYQYWITSHVYTLGLKLEEADPDALSSSIDTFLAAAEACNEGLVNLCSALPTDVQNGTSFVEITAFEHTVLAWRNAALAASVNLAKAGEPDASLLKSLIQRMISVVQRFESTLNDLKTVDDRRALIGTNAKQPLPLQLKHLLRYSHRVYSAFTVSMLDIHRRNKGLDDSSSTSSLLLRYLPLLESMVRRSIECDLIATHDSNLKSQNRLGKLKTHKSTASGKPDYMAQSELPHGHHTYTNRLTYPDHLALGDTKQQRLLSGWRHDAFTLHVVQYVQAIVERPSLEWNAHRGDMVRLLLLLQDYASRHDDNSVQTETKDSIHQLLNHILPFPKDRRHWKKRGSFGDGSSTASRVAVPLLARRKAPGRRSRPKPSAIRARASATSTY